MEHLKTKIRHVPDFPKSGILFYDITTLLQDPVGLRDAIDALVTPFKNDGIEVVVGIESRGFILGSVVADRLRAGFAPVRKQGKLPSTKLRASYDLEYGTDCLEIHDDAVKRGQKVLIVDDLLATGGTASATCDLVQQLGGNIHALAFLIELVALDGRSKLADRRIHTVLKYELLLIPGALIVAAAVAWAAWWITRGLASRGESHDQKTSLMAMFAPGIAAAADDPRALLAWQSIATTSRKLYPTEFAALDQAAGGTFPFTADQIERAHARWTTDWLAWERTHDAECKLKTAIVEHELGAAVETDYGRARLDAVERDKLDHYQRRYEEYTRVSRALQALLTRH